ncbi:MAG: glycosyltransferase family 2 protein, partial [Candidatus Staskawiczbacteria bacterium]
MITVILPTYKRPQMLKRAVQSVLNQTYPNFQICIYDNASGDKTAEVVAEMAKKDDRIKYFCQAENIGASKNFNYGMSQVKTPFFAWIADDDIILPDFFEIAMKGLEEHPKAAFFSGTDII